MVFFLYPVGPSLWANLKHPEGRDTGTCPHWPVGLPTVVQIARMALLPFGLAFRGGYRSAQITAGLGHWGVSLPFSFVALRQVGIGAVLGLWAVSATFRTRPSVQRRVRFRERAGGYKPLRRFRGLIHVQLNPDGSVSSRKGGENGIFLTFGKPPPTFCRTGKP
jgi:hypothetical protein